MKYNITILGIAFEGGIKHKMGTVEINDQVAGLTHLIAQGIVDPSKIVITGWSYGGYLSLMGLCQRPDIFQVSTI
jgi:dipeptidyl aminopeptidase/acylaminoacyl peptidase